MIKSIRKGSTSYILLTVLEKTIDGYMVFDDLIHNPKLEGRFLKKSKLSQAIRRLRDGGFIIQEKIDDEKIIFRLTDTGRFLITDPDEEKGWDGKWRIVVFDIPEQKRVIRNLFRRNLKKWGFKHFQKSVWVSRRDVFEGLKLYIDDLGIEKWVAVIEANKISNKIIT